MVLGADLSSTCQWGNFSQTQNVSSHYHPESTPGNLGCPFKWIDFSLSGCPTNLWHGTLGYRQPLSMRESEHLLLGNRFSWCSPSPSGGEKDIVKQDPAVPLAACKAGKTWATRKDT